MKVWELVQPAPLHYFKTTICSIVLTWCTLFLYAQPTNIDSLLVLLEQKQATDTSRISLTLRITDKLFFQDPKKTISLLRALDPLMNQASRFQQVDRHHYFGAAYQQLQQVDSVEYYHRSILSLISQEDDEKRYARALANLGTTYRLKGDLEEAARMNEAALAVFAKLDNPMPKGSIRNSLALVYEAQGNYQAAMKYYLEALDFFIEAKHEGAQAIILNNIGKLYHSQQDYEKAINYFQQYRNRSQQSNNQRGIAVSLTNIGIVFLDQGQLDSASYYLNKSVEAKKKNQFMHDLSTSLSNLGKIAHKQGNYYGAIEYSQEALKLAKQQENKKDESYCLITMANSYEQLQQYPQARTNYLQALALAKEMGDLKLQYNANEGLYRSFKPDNREKALLHLENAFLLKDSLLNAKNVEAMTTLRLEYDFNKKELLAQQKISTLELQEKLSNARLANQQIIILGLVGTLVLFGFLMYQLRTQRNQIKKQNEIIQQSLAEKDTLLREIHHRVKNNLQVISSLLGIQSRHVKNQVAVDALNEGRNRVQTMSLIHQDLYQKDNLTGIDIRPFFSKLLANLLNTYQVQKEQVQIHTNIDDLILDVDTVIPLGLILNELISNALKYAFPNGKGIIEVSLKEIETGLSLRVKDNGIGLENETLYQGESYGYELIRALVDKLEGDLKVTGTEGTSVNILLKAYRKAA